jgi:8-oxo-dGTP diphosphatase
MSEDIIIKNKIRQKIMQKLMHNPGSSFNKLWPKDEIESNKFAYHLKNLEEDGFITKEDSGYFLSHKGREVAVFLEGTDGTKKKKPLNVVGVVLFNENGEVLLHERKKEPFYGHYGIGAGGKIEYGEYMEEAAAKELLEETGLEADLELACIYNMITYNNGELSYHHTHFIYRGRNPRGSLNESHRECLFRWMKLEDALKHKMFPDVPHIVQTVKEGVFKIIEIERTMENDEFTGFKVLNEIIPNKSL